MTERIYSLELDFNKRSKDLTDIIVDFNLTFHLTFHLNFKLEDKFYI